MSTINEFLEEELRKVDLEIDHYEHAIKHDKERLSFFVSVKQYLESSVKNVSIINDYEKNVKEFLEGSSSTLVQVGEDLFEKYKVEENMTVDKFGVK